MMEKQLTCSQCGGKLVANEEYDLYMCRSCGVAFGRSLLEHVDALQEADAAFQRGEFSAADRLYQIAQIQDTDNFYSLVGRIKCAARWKELKEVYNYRPIMRFRIDLIKTRIAESVRYSNKQDMHFFEVLQKLFDSRASFQILEEELNSNSPQISEETLLKNVREEKEKFRQIKKELIEVAETLQPIHGDVFK